MQNKFIKHTGIAMAIASLPFSALADDASEVAQLRKQLDVQSATLQALTLRLQQLENANRASSQQSGRFIKAAATSENEPTTSNVGPNSSEDAPSGQAGSDEVIKEAPASRSQQAVYREQNALFNKTFTLETGVTYSHTDRRELLLNGFLALDAIFLGQISLDRVKSDILQFDVTGRYGVTDRLQFDFNAPFLYRRSTFQSGGVNSSATAISEQDVTTADVGDVSAGAFYRIFTETTDTPDVVVNMRVKAPTGKDPFGIKLRRDPNNANLQYPRDLPTGNGVWSLSTGITLVKTIDPAILFANMSYTHNFKEKFSDISTDPNTKTSAEVELGDSIQLGGGMAFALNERMSMSMSYAHRFSEKARIQAQGQDRQSVIGSDTSAGSLNFGVTYAMTDRLSMVTNVGLGVTPDAPDITVGIKFPYNF